MTAKQVQHKFGANCPAMYWAKGKMLLAQPGKHSKGRQPKSKKRKK